MVFLIKTPKWFIELFDYIKSFTFTVIQKWFYILQTPKKICQLPHNRLCHIWFAYLQNYSIGVLWDEPPICVNPNDHII